MLLSRLALRSGPEPHSRLRRRPAPPGSDPRAASLGLLLLCASCGNPFDNPFGAALRQKPAERTAGKVDAGRAEVSLVVKVEKVSGGGGRGELRDMWRVVHLLATPGRDGIEILATSPDFGTEEAVRLADARYELQAAPDGRALAFSADGGATWGVAWFGDPETALVCTHLALPRDALWHGVPGERDLAVAVLAGGSHDDREQRNVLAYIAAHPDAADLHGELAEAATREAGTVDVWNLSRFPFFSRLREAVRLHAPARARYTTALVRADGRHSVASMNAAALLGGADDAESQDALAATLARSLAVTDDSMYRDSYRKCLAGALARVTDARRGGSEQVRAAVVAALGRDLLDGVGTIWLIRAAARLDRAAVEQEAARDCEETERPLWPDSFDEFAVRVEDPAPGKAFAPCCWAKAALGR